MDLSRFVSLICLVVSTLAYAETPLEDYPGLEVVDTRHDDTLSSRRLILGSLKKINNLLEPERVEYISGTRGSMTAFIPNERRTDTVKKFYRDQLRILGEILFECRGRTCGSSNYWANTVFGASILYGPEQFQHYILAKLKNGDYIAVYVAMRGTRKLYVHVETTTTRKSGRRVARYIYQTSDAAVTAARKILAEGGVTLHLVVHQGLKEYEGMDDAVSRSLNMGGEIRKRLADRDQVVVHGLGGLAPDDALSADRIELLVIRR